MTRKKTFSFFVITRNGWCSRFARSPGTSGSPRTDGKPRQRRFCGSAGTTRPTRLEWDAGWKRYEPFIVLLLTYFFGCQNSRLVFCKPSEPSKGQQSELLRLYNIFEFVDWAILVQLQTESIPHVFYATWAVAHLVGRSLTFVLGPQGPLTSEIVIPSRAWMGQAQTNMSCAV